MLSKNMFLPLEIDELILTESQPLLGYFMPSG